ncbi:DNA recombination protein RmuC [Nakamurella flavida]|uniref:DNA recombination protein RmuC n=1 Tax=Nakamurella flavida TaxID=363630 RepID=A0A938YFU8_9ACTN|nr:DNA recombination protein RmuC [Nakamurella flavida]MBM9476901.1 DNA recombination protein RmuC [Nakamurella flavida]MDP9779845.1 DNA recombination protein RmuC [Nakamurella flavida]
MDATTLLLGAALIAVGVGLGLLIGRSTGSSRAADTAQLSALLAPASQAMQRVEDRLREVERDRVGAYAGLHEQVAALHRASTELGGQTRSLVGALRAPQVRGRWGEIQLQRIVELAGMVEHCDFDVQVSAPGARDRAGRAAPGVRPDMVVRLSGGRSIPVDAKMPFAAWLAALDAPDDRQRAGAMAAHARALRGHVDALAGKAYWSAFQPAPEFVVLFVPGEPLLDAALVHDPGLADHAFSRSVILATPTTLIALLRTIAFTWRQETLTASATEIHALGRELHGRLATMAEHLARAGTGLERAVESYNQLVRSMDSRVLVTARRFTDLGVPGEPAPAAPPIGSTPLRAQSTELRPPTGGPAGLSPGPDERDARPPSHTPAHRPAATVER